MGEEQYRTCVTKLFVSKAGKTSIDFVDINVCKSLQTELHVEKVEIVVVGNSSV